MPTDDTADPAFPDPVNRLVLDDDCERCPSLAACRTRISWGVGPPDATVVVVGEAPGAGDPDAAVWKGGNHTGLAYTSRHSGRRVRRLFESLGVDAYYTNAVKCFPADPADPSTNREPTAEERANCREHLRAELDAIGPELVVATGAHATRTMLAFEDREIDGFLDAILTTVSLPSLDVTLLPILHPSYQDVWLSRLGYDAEEYRAAIAAHLP